MIIVKCYGRDKRPIYMNNTLNVRMLFNILSDFNGIDVLFHIIFRDGADFKGLVQITNYYYEDPRGKH